MASASGGRTARGHMWSPCDLAGALLASAWAKRRCCASIHLDAEQQAGTHPAGSALTFVAREELDESHQGRDAIPASLLSRRDQRHNSGGSHVVPGTSCGSL